MSKRMKDILFLKVMIFFILNLRKASIIHKKDENIHTLSIKNKLMSHKSQ